MDFANIDWFTVALVAFAAVAVFFMFRNSKKRREAEQEMRNKIQPGAQVLTQGGLYGELIELDSEANVAVIETTPGVKIRLHSSVILRVVDETEPETEESADDADDSASDETRTRND